MYHRWSPLVLMWVWLALTSRKKRNSICWYCLIWIYLNCGSLERRVRWSGNLSAAEDHTLVDFLGNKFPYSDIFDMFCIPDNCAPNPCANNGTCTDNIISYSCQCADGYNGNNCENNINECNGVTCENGGTCQDGINSYICQCVAGFDGNTCENSELKWIPSVVDPGFSPRGPDTMLLKFPENCMKLKKIRRTSPATP